MCWQPLGLPRPHILRMRWSQAILSTQNSIFGDLVFDYLTKKDKTRGAASGAAKPRWSRQTTAVSASLTGSLTATLVQVLIEILIKKRIRERI